ncbi:hypothetical protein K525DRAFT_274813 [Schizophyllum commune Loenen D]|nr:hypothetical protein K525DRAFT_274813 [Schizophyllum commune Loenen D]
MTLDRRAVLAAVKEAVVVEPSVWRSLRLLPFPDSRQRMMRDRHDTRMDAEKPPTSRTPSLCDVENTLGACSPRYRNRDPPPTAGGKRKFLRANDATRPQLLENPGPPEARARSPGMMNAKRCRTPEACAEGILLAPRGLAEDPSTPLTPLLAPFPQAAYPLHASVETLLDSCMHELPEARARFIGEGCDGVGTTPSPFPSFPLLKILVSCTAQCPYQVSSCSAFSRKRPPSSEEVGQGMTWKGWTRTRTWKESLPEVLILFGTSQLA